MCDTRERGSYLASLKGQIPLVGSKEDPSLSLSLSANIINNIHSLRDGTQRYTQAYTHMHTEIYARKISRRKPAKQLAASVHFADDLILVFLHAKC